MGDRRKGKDGEMQRKERINVQKGGVQARIERTDREEAENSGEKEDKANDGENDRQKERKTGGPIKMEVIEI